MKLLQQRVIGFCKGFVIKNQYKPSVFRRKKTFQTCRNMYQMNPDWKTLTWIVKKVIRRGLCNNMKRKGCNLVPLELNLPVIPHCKILSSIQPTYDKAIRCMNSCISCLCNLHKDCCLQQVSTQNHSDTCSEDGCHYKLKAVKRQQRGNQKGVRRCDWILFGTEWLKLYESAYLIYCECAYQCLSVTVILWVHAHDMHV